VRLRLQRRIDRVFYGARRDPVRAIAEVGARLGEVSGDGSTGLAGVLEVLCQVMRLPSASILVAGREIAAYGMAPALRQSVTLRQGGEALGELTIGLRTGEFRLAAADERVIGLLSAPLAVALHAISLAAELGKARESLVTAREEERRRLRRDLHDGLGPALTGVVLKADAARRLAGPESGQVAQLLAELRAQTTAAVEDIRRLVNELRPSALDALGLVEALRGQAVLLSRRTDGSSLQVIVHADEPFPSLPPAAEVAAYRIATEALTNIARHSAASTATVHLRAEPTALALTVQDDGQPDGEWRAGIGLTSMNERATELGGICHAGPTQDGGQVSATIPLGSS
jgi:two-component system, NarL family, sensor kinase